MLTLVEVLGAELNKKFSLIFRHNLTGIVESVIRTSAIAQEEPEDVGRIGVELVQGSGGDTCVLRSIFLCSSITLKDAFCQ